MFSPESQVRVFVRREATDMRCSFSGLISLTRNILKHDPLSGHLFVFINRGGDYVKVLWWDRSGYCIWSKRLERGTFLVQSWNESGEISTTELKLILEGYERKDVKKVRRFALKNDDDSCRSKSLCGMTQT